KMDRPLLSKFGFVANVLTSSKGLLDSPSAMQLFVRDHTRKTGLISTNLGMISSIYEMFAF
ncbi:MAG TPA: hypothetical protein VJR28_03460, partial [Chthoniobacterales bacterium]|nr:hypothetical protein [Chthoniobacterales bacterium]